MACMPINNIGTITGPYKGWNWVDNEKLFLQIGFEAVVRMASEDCLVRVLAHVWPVQYVCGHVLCATCTGVTLVGEVDTTTFWLFITMSFSTTSLSLKKKNGDNSDRNDRWFAGHLSMMNLG